MRSGENYSEPFPHLRIIDDATFYQAQKLFADRGEEHDYKWRHPRIVKGECLLSGNIYCGYCGSRHHVNAAQKNYTRKTNVQVVKCHFLHYSCYTKTRDKTLCDGQVTYRAHIIDNAVEAVIKQFFNKLQGVSYHQIMENQYKIS